MTRRVVVLGADGFVGRHIIFALRRRGYAVCAVARRPERLHQMGFETLTLDLEEPTTHAPEFWRKHLEGAALVNAAGLLTGTPDAFRAVHVRAPAAAYAALGNSNPAILISAIGTEADTAFAKWRREGEAIAKESGNVCILRPGLILGETSYGGSSLLRALAALPFRQPVVGDGNQPFNPVHADDLAVLVVDALETPLGTGPWEVGGPQTMTQTELFAAYRSWLGLRPASSFHLSARAAAAIGNFGDALKLGPISRTSVKQLGESMVADTAPLEQERKLSLRGVTEFLSARPAGTQDLWQARLYLLRPVIRMVLALLWTVSGLLGLFTPTSTIMDALAGTQLPSEVLTALARIGGLVDLVLAVALLVNWRPRLIALAQITVVLGYTVGLTLVAPWLWVAPFGDLLKNLPVLVLLCVHLAVLDER